MGKDSCSVPGCVREAICRTWCRSHYMRWRNTGDVQADKPLPGDLPDGVGWCARCRDRKPIADFHRATDRPSGRSSYCRPCMTFLRGTKYKAVIKLQQKRWADRNPDAIRGYEKAWRSKNPERVRANKSAWVANNPERYLAAARAGDSARRAREKGAPGRSTTAQIKARWEYFGNRCWMCGDPAEATDHVKPLSKGGSHWPANLRPACHPCNNSKRAKWPYPLEVARGGAASGREVSAGRPA